MKTDALIAMLARGPVVADTRRPTRSLWLAVVCGLPVAFVIMWLVLGPRPDLATAAGGAMFWLKLMMPVALACALFAAVAQLARPGGAPTGPLLAVAAMLASLWLAAAVDLLAAPPLDRLHRVEGTSAASCVLTIALLALPLLLAIGLALRSAAPTLLARTGACAGALAGSIAASVYALHCTEATLPFLATWYVLGMALPAVLGRMLAPRLLSWA